MERYIYYCPNCHYLGSAEHSAPNEYQGCSECKSAMVYAGYTKAEWDTKSKEEKEQIKAEGQISGIRQFKCKSSFT